MFFKNTEFKMLILNTLSKLQKLENHAKIYYESKNQQFSEPISFDFSLLLDVYKTIKLLPLNKEKIELMQRFQHVFSLISTFHPKLIYYANFGDDLALYKPLIEKLDSLKKQALEYFGHYFDIVTPAFDWQALFDIRQQINKLQDGIEKTQLMNLFEYGALATVSQVQPKIYMSLTFRDELFVEQINFNESLSP